MTKQQTISDKAAARLQRGQTTAEEDARYAAFSSTDLLALLDDAHPQARTSAAKWLGERRYAAAVPVLCAHLQTETALYPRIAICDALAAIGTPAIPALIALIGRVGANQHTELPQRGFYKKSYPLPRDLAVRTLIRIGPAALPSLEQVIQSGERSVVLDAIDAVGHIAFYSRDTRSEAVLLAAYQTHSADAVVRWKLIRAFQSFPSGAVRRLLESIILADEIPALRWEAVRSLGLHGGGLPAAVLNGIAQDADEELRKLAGMFSG